MSEAPDLAVPEAAAPAQAAVAAEAPAVGAAAPAADAPVAELATPEPEAGEGEAAAAAEQGAGKGEAVDTDGKSKDEGTEGAKEGGADTNGAPETYADFTMPEGVVMDPALGTDLTALAKELNLPQDKAQKLVDIGVKQAQAFATAMETSVNAAKTQWLGEVRADPEIGGAKLTENMVIAKRAVVAFGTPALVGLLNQTGLSQHPEMLRLLTRVGAAISEDTLVDGGGSPAGGKPAVRDHAKRLYPGMK